MNNLVLQEIVRFVVGDQKRQNQEGEPCIESEFRSRYNWSSFETS